MSNEQRDDVEFLLHFEIPDDEPVVETTMDIQEAEEQVVANISLDVSPSKVSELENDVGFITREDTTNTRTYPLGETTDRDEDGKYVWTIQHNLGKYPNTFVVDSAGSKVLPDFDYPDENTVIIKSNYSFTGKAYIN